MADKTDLQKKTESMEVLVARDEPERLALQADIDALREQVAALLAKKGKKGKDPASDSDDPESRSHGQLHDLRALIIAKENRICAIFSVLNTMLSSAQAAIPAATAAPAPHPEASALTLIAEQMAMSQKLLTEKWRPHILRYDQERASIALMTKEDIIRQYQVAATHQALTPEDMKMGLYLLKLTPEEQLYIAALNLRKCGQPRNVAHNIFVAKKAGGTFLDQHGETIVSDRMQYPMFGWEPEFAHLNAGLLAEASTAPTGGKPDGRQRRPGYNPFKRDYRAPTGGDYVVPVTHGPNGDASVNLTEVDDAFGNLTQQHQDARATIEDLKREVAQLKQAMRGRGRGRGRGVDYGYRGVDYGYRGGDHGFRGGLDPMYRDDQQAYRSRNNRFPQGGDGAGQQQQPASAARPPDPAPAEIGRERRQQPGF